MGVLPVRHATGDDIECLVTVLSLVHRSDVFVVMLRYLNELAFYYIAAENAQVRYHRSLL